LLTNEDLHAVLSAVHDDLAAADEGEGDVDPSLRATAQLSLSTAVPSEPRVLEPRLCVGAWPRQHQKRGYHFWLWDR
jgi:hypothetical protein